MRTLPTTLDLMHNAGRGLALREGHAEELDYWTSRSIDQSAHLRLAPSIVTARTRNHAAGVVAGSSQCAIVLHGPRFRRVSVLASAQA